MSGMANNLSHSHEDSVKIPPPVSIKGHDALFRSTWKAMLFSMCCEIKGFFTA